MTERNARFICNYYLFIISLVAVILLSVIQAATLQKRSDEIQMENIYQPEYEHQIIAWPEENFNDNEGVIDSNEMGVAVSTKKPIQVIENFHKILPNKTEEHKLTLDNGLFNYKRIDKKITRNGVTDTVQEGYYSVPSSKTALEGQNQNYQIVHYKADSNGYRVYTVDRPSSRYL